MNDQELLLPKHGGYRKLKSFQIARLVYDVTVLFCDRYISRRSRTHDQMVQAARSGVQNIAEGSKASGTSRKTELKLTNVARSSLEELRLDYEDFLRQNGLSILPPDHPALMRFKRMRCATLEDVRRWVAKERKRSAKNTDEHGQRKSTDELKNTDKHGLARTSTDQEKTNRRSSAAHPVRGSPWSSVPVCALPSSALAANAALSLLNLACALLDRQIAAQASSFTREGGFTERMYRVRASRRGK
jgi:four helix bundle suffix protein